jgi:hypothetical protein
MRLINFGLDQLFDKTRCQIRDKFSAPRLSSGPPENLIHSPGALIALIVLPSHLARARSNVICENQAYERSIGSQLSKRLAAEQL